ncbi:MAG: hypothetical protein WBN39_00380 [Flavobacteriaceae bacterium]
MKNNILFVMSFLLATWITNAQTTTSNIKAVERYGRTNGSALLFTMQ